MNQFLIKLKTLLRYNNFYYIIFLVVVLISISYPFKSSYNGLETSFKGLVIDIKKDYYILSGKEKVIVKDINDNLSYGDYVIIDGSFKEIEETRNFNVFSYKNYLKSKGIYWFFHAKSYQVIKSNNPFYILKNKLYSHINTYNGSEYIYALMLQDTDLIDKDIYQKASINHIFSLSGMHISVFVYFILLLVKKFIKRTILSYSILIFILTIYAFFANFSLSIVRSILLVMFIFINKTFNLQIKTYNLIILIASIILISNPLLIGNTGFYYAFIISYLLSKFSNYFKKYKTFIEKTVVFSIMIFLITLPLNIYNNSYINLTSIITNILITPVITFVLYPLSFITLLLPNSNLIEIIFNVLNYIIEIISKNQFILIFAKPSIWLILLYYLLICIFLERKTYRYLIALIIILFIHYGFSVSNSNEIHMIDVGTGDSFLLTINKKTVLFDTGYNSNNIIQYLRSFGVKKIDYLIITHGDSDHAGGAINIIENYKINNVVFNINSYNDLEESIIKKCNQHNINYFKASGKLANIEFLNYYIGGENESSIVALIKVYNKDILMTGDIPSMVEYQLIKKYDLSDIDILKVSHHGSNTSSSKLFIDVVNPKISLISAKMNNRYNHPSDIVVNRLKNSTILNTQLSGSVRIIFNDKLKIFTKLKGY